MRLLVVGAAGRTGRHIVEQALGHGHEVRAMVHAHPLALSNDRLQQVTCDVRDFECVSAAVAGSDAVAVALGSGATRPVTVFSEGIANVVHAMALHQVRTLAAVSAAGAFARTDPHLSLKFRAMIATTLRATYEDLERMEQRIAASGLDWTIIRPVGLSDEPRSGHYRMTLDGSLLSKAGRISREDVAGCVLKALETGSFVRRTMVIGQ